MADEAFTVDSLVRFSDQAVTLLGAARAEIDDLNVYPVPDGDTGTNLFLTFEAAHAALLASLQDQHGPAGPTGPAGPEGPDLATTAAAYSRGLLLGARGNSGVIMSQLVGALLKRLSSAVQGQEDPATALSAAMEEATDAAYAAVGQPVEGTMLTVARAAARAAATRAGEPGADPAAVFGAASAAAELALSRTPEQLSVLRDAGVVDAGGRGVCVVLEAAVASHTPEDPGAVTHPTRAARRRRRLTRHPAGQGGGQGRPQRTRRNLSQRFLPRGDLSEDGPAYEVMFLLDAAAESIPPLRRRLLALGDSLVLVGGDALYNVHIHVDDVGAAIEAGVEAGRPHRIRVTHFHEQRAQRALLAEGGDQPSAERAVVAVTFAEGLAKVFAEAGATVVPATSGSRPSTGRILEAIEATGAAEVIVLTNEGDVVPAAETAARLAESERGVKVAVIPTTAQVQGMAALAVHEARRPFDRDLVEMTAAARHARSGAVTVAVREAMTTAGPCRVGDALGEVEGDYTVVGPELHDVAMRVIDRLLGGGGELFTIITGAGAEELAEQCVEHVRRSRPSVDVMRYEGGQERYPLLFGVE